MLISGPQTYACTTGNTNQGTLFHLLPMVTDIQPGPSETKLAVVETTPHLPLKVFCPTYPEGMSFPTLPVVEGGSILTTEMISV
jgi:hypothetical protein